MSDEERKFLILKIFRKIDIDSYFDFVKENIIILNNKTYLKYGEELIELDEEDFLSIAISFD